MVTLTVGAWAKEGKRRGGGENKNTPFSLLSPAPAPVPLTRPISSSLREVSTWRFREQIARLKKTPALQATNILHFSSENSLQAKDLDKIMNNIHTYGFISDKFNSFCLS